MGSHLINGEFQSDRYPTCPAGKVPLSVLDETAQDLLWQYAQRRRSVDAEFSDDLEAALLAAGYLPDRKDLGLSDLASGVVRRSDSESRSVRVRNTPIRSLITEAVQHIPPGFHLTIGIERIVDDDGSDGGECLHANIYHVNALGNGTGWISLPDWRTVLVPWLLESYPRASGGWHITHAIEVERPRSTP